MDQFHHHFSLLNECIEIYTTSSVQLNVSIINSILVPFFTGSFCSSPWKSNYWNVVSNDIAIVISKMSTNMTSQKQHTHAHNKQTEKKNTLPITATAVKWQRNLLGTQLWAFHYGVQQGGEYKALSDSPARVRWSELRQIDPMHCAV